MTDRHPQRSEGHASRASAPAVELIDRARGRDLEAIDAIVDLYAKRLFSFFRRMCGDRHQAEDLVQEVFVRLVRNIESYDHRGRFDAWIFRIAGNLARDRARRLSRPHEVSGMEQSAGDDRAFLKLRAAPSDEGDPLEMREDVDQLQRALEELPEHEREVVLMRHYGGLSFAEIADMMGTPIGTALARAHRGLARLREIMERAA